MENSTGNINQGRPVYFSYARNSSRKPEWEHISDSVETLLETMTANHLEYRVDIKDIGTGDKISKFEQEIGWNSEVVVIVFSDKYFRSMHCMYEFVQIKNALRQYPDKRLMCIKSGDFNLADINYIMELEDYWSDQKKEYEKIEYHRLRNHSGTEKAAWQNGFYLEEIRNLYSFFSAINYSNAASINYDNFVGDIVKYYKTTPKPDRTPNPPQNNPQPQTQTADTQTHITQPQTNIAQPQHQQQFVQPVQQPAQQPASKAVQQPAQQSVQSVNTLQQITKKIPQKVIVGVIAVLLVLVGILTQVKNFKTGEDESTIFKKAEELYNAGNYSAAVVYYEELATKGNLEAKCYTGLCYYELEKYTQAVKWFEEAAEEGVASAQYVLGVCYLYGEGVSKDIHEAKYWLEMAADQGNEDARIELRKLHNMY